MKIIYGLLEKSQSRNISLFESQTLKYIKKKHNIWALYILYDTFLLTSE